MNRTAILLTCIALASPVWAQRNLKDIPNPDPEIERESFILGDGYEVNLFASDPQFAKPIHMNFDAQGRLWIASSEVYPHIKPGQKATDKIIVLEDKDGDGVAETRHVFVDNLLIPTGVAPTKNGCYVANSTELVYFEDLDGDMRADKRTVILSGFGTEDTHHLLHSLRWGPDGCLYMNQSIYIHSHVETPYGVMRMNGGGIWRFRPETMKLDVFCLGFVNPWGHHFDSWGQSFATDGAFGEGINYVFPGSVFTHSPGEPRRLRGLNPGSPKHCSLEIISGRHFPDAMQGNMITNDFRANRVCRFVVTPDGSGYASRQETEIIKTKHVAFRPIDVKMGSDGALYIADWYNPIIQHGEVDFRDPRRDHVHGRIWRVTAKDRKTIPRTEIASAEIKDLLDLLNAPENWVRLHAKLELKRRDHDEVAAALTAWLSELDPQATSYDHQRLEAMWLLQCLNRSHEPMLASLLQSPDHRTRAAAMRVVGWRQKELDSSLQYMTAGVHDDHPQVRLEAVRALALRQRRDAAEIAMLALNKPMDRFLDFALWRTMRELKEHWLPALKQGEVMFGGDVNQLTFAVQAADAPGVVAPLVQIVRQGELNSERRVAALNLIAGLGSPQDLQFVFEQALDSQGNYNDAQRTHLMNALGDANLRRKVKPAGDLTRLRNAISSDTPSLAVAAIRAAGIWKLESMREALAKRAGGADGDDTVRFATYEALARLGGPQSLETLSKIATSDTSAVHQQRAVTALAQVAPRRAANVAVQILSRAQKGDQRVAKMIQEFLGRKNGPTLLAEALADKQLDSEVAKVVLQGAYAATNASPDLIKAIQKAGNLQAAGWKLTPEFVAEIVESVATTGDPALGEVIYRRERMQCLNCHAIGGAGGLVGPDLVSIGASAPVDYLVESLIDPNKKVKENYHSVVIQTDEGQVITGIPIRQSDRELTLRNVDDKQVVVPLDSIEAKRDGRSLMPNGLVDSLTREELVHLVTFLSKLGKVGDYAVSKTPTLRTWQALAHTREANHRIRRTSFDIVTTDDPALTWRPVYSQVNGTLPLGDLPQFDPITQENAHTSFVRGQIEISTPGKLVFNLSDPNGLTLWVDGTPTGIAPKVEVELKQGLHTIHLAVNHKQRQTPIHVTVSQPNQSPAQFRLVSGK